MVTSPRCFPYTTTCLRVRQSPKGKDYVVRDTVLELGPPSGPGKLIHYCWTRTLLEVLEAPGKQMGFSHTSPMATQVLQHRCDQWASADAGIVRQDSPRASRPQAILKFRPPSSLDYKARHGPQTIQKLLNDFKNWHPNVCFRPSKPGVGTTLVRNIYPTVEIHFYKVMPNHECIFSSCAFRTTVHWHLSFR